MEERSPEKENLVVDDALAQKGGTEKVGSEGPVLVSDTSSERREDEEEGSDQGRKTPSPRPNEEEGSTPIPPTCSMRIFHLLQNSLKLPDMNCDPLSVTIS